MKLTNSVAIITGANRGIGYEVALELAKRDCRVYLACRDVSKMRTIINELKVRSGSVKIHGRYLDLTNLETIHEFAREILSIEKRIDYLINNAGVMWLPERKLTNDNFETQIQTNYIGQFLLTHLLFPLLDKTVNSRVINVTSSSYSNFNKPEFDFTMSKYDAVSAYNAASLYSVAFTKQLSKLHPYCFSVNTGYAFTEIYKSYSSFYQFIAKSFGFLFKFLLKTPEDAAHNVLFCALQPNIAVHSGKFYSDCKPENPSGLAANDEFCRRLWKATEVATNINFSKKLTK